MEAAEKASLKGTGKGGAGGNGLMVVGADGKEKVKTEREKAMEKGERFEIMANVVWAEIGKAIMDELGSTVFAAGKPEEFRKVRCTDWYPVV